MSRVMKRPLADIAPLIECDGGRAFPSKLCAQDGMIASLGMSLRDYFAAAALQRASFGEYDPASEIGTAYMARHAYRLADAMLAERSKADA